MFVGLAVLLVPQITLKQIGADEGVGPIVSTNSTHNVEWRFQVDRAAAASRIAVPSEESGDDASNEVVNRALSAVGTRYRWGGTNLSGFDCSGLVRYAYADRASILPRSSYSMRSAVGNASTLKPGDIVFFGWRAAYHVGIYVGDGRFVHASTAYGKVRVDNLTRMIGYLGFLGNGRI